ncbi:coiled-coil domain-containing protein 130 homolog [Condylostylus longicornis]|uniref:coiled-coil domain-containing protein 130 homolog n=1 Tax=Condylostylus longicornis TaxID=2530218 RepID=UPI00244DD378|nr:coiled-coil domain-containing protein 130 homolog [Condylostylus longicornis]
MGERKGTNKYYPPDYDPKKGGLNKFLGTHALRERARKIHLGIIIIRFEMPYNIWCEGCNNHIGMGVRYNAEKTRIGNYYSTPIYQFRMKCHLCDNHFEIKTDPANLDYVIVSGARRQENRWDPHSNEQIVPETKELQKKLVDDPMFKLEHQIKDQQKAEKSKPELVKLYDRNLDVWYDNYDLNCKLRADFRSKKKDIKLQQEKDDALLKKSSLEIDLLPENDQDKRIAALMKLQTRSAQENDEVKRLDILTKPALPSATITTFGGLKRHKLISNKLSISELGIKRKRTNDESLPDEVINTNGQTIEDTVKEDKEDKQNNLEHQNDVETNEIKEKINKEKAKDLSKENFEAKSLALVCDYSSSEESNS